MGDNPSRRKGKNLPAEPVSWDDAVAFIAKLNAQNDGYTYRLPSEAEWEYAARAGVSGDYLGDPAMAWCRANSGDKTHPVGQKKPNAFGLFDMQGNVSEWCADWYHDNYVGAPIDGSAWLSGSEQKERVVRGGAYYESDLDIRSSSRGQNHPFVGYNIGLRVVAVART
jgi:formylglycine-generating enzyme required for sulfatase activity